MMASSIVLQTSATCSIVLPSSSSSQFSSHRFQGALTLQTFSLRKESGVAKAQFKENISSGIRFGRAHFPIPVLKAAGRSADSVDDSSSVSSGIEMVDEVGIVNGPIAWNSSAEDQQEGIVLSTRPAFQSLTQDVAMGLVLREAAGTSWTTGSGLEGPAGEIENEGKEELKFPDLSKSPRRKMRVAFTCNVCRERTIRAINPLAYTDGTVFVQCKGCDVFHKLVDNLNLFHEMKGKIYRGYDIPWYANDQPYDFLGDQYPLL